MGLLLEFDRNVWIACAPAIVLFCFMFVAFAVDLYLINRKGKKS